MKVMNLKTRTAIAVILIGVITVCSILIIEKFVRFVRIDLTEQKLYTLSDGTLNIISKINQPIHMKLYFARTAAMKAPESIRFFNNYYYYVRKLLEEYIERSKGSITLKVIDPRPFSDDEEEALRFNLKRFAISDDESFFFGLLVETEFGKSDVIAFFEPDRQEFVEYDISKIVSGLMTREKKKIGIMSSLPVLGTEVTPYMERMLRMQGKGSEKAWHFVEQLRQEYEIGPIANDVESIDSIVDFLIVMHPKDLSETTLFAIDQYVMRGGYLIVFIDPHCLADKPVEDPQNPYASIDYKAASNLNALLENWGVTMPDNQIAADRSLAITGAIRRDQRPSPIITFLELGEDNVNKDEIMTTTLHSITMLYAGSLETVEGAGTTVTPLLLTSALGNTWEPSSQFALNMPQPEKMLQDFSDGDEPLMLACRISGKLKTNFPDGIESEQEDEEEEEEGTGESDSGEEQKEDDEKTEVIQEAPADASVIVIADVDIVSDVLAYRENFFGISQVGDNASLILNALEFMRGSGDLIKIRSRGQFSRPFEVVDEIEQKAEKKTAIEVAELNERIQASETRLRELGRPKTKADAKLIQSKAIEERRKIEAEKRTAQKQLRSVNAGKRESIEKLGERLQTMNMFGAPIAVLLIAICLALLRYAKAKRYVMRRKSR